MKSLTIGAKFRAGFLALLSLTLILGFSSVFALRSMNQTFDDAVQITSRKIQLGGDINAMEGDLFLAQRALVLAGFGRDPERSRTAKREFEEGTAKLKEGLGAIAPLLSTPEEKRLEQVMRADLDQWLAAYLEVVRSVDSGNPAKANLISYQQVRPIYLDFEDAAYKLSSGSQQSMAEDQKTAAGQYSRDSWLAGVLSLLALLVGAGIFWVTNQVTGELRRVTQEIALGADQVASASGQIATGSQTLSQGASQQASSVEEISASMEQMTEMTKSSGANSAEAMAKMVQTALQVERSNAALAEMLVSMGSIKSSSERVAKINKTIDEIAFQTNILALNAAVEAARAGEAGKGFAVVADEVRNLAQRAAAAAKDTAALIEESIANSNQGAQKLELVSAAIHGITEGAQQVKLLVGEVNDASQQQVQGIQQVSIAIEQVNKVTQSNASNSEESAAAAQELNAQSMTVRELVNKLRRMVDGGVEHRVPRGNQGEDRRGISSLPQAGRDPAADAFSMEAEEAGSFRGF